MMVDVAPQQQLTEVFTTSRSHHRSSSASTHRRNSTTNTNNNGNVSSSSTSNNMTTGHRLLKHELGKKAEQILGHAPIVFDSHQQAHFDLSHHTQPSRLFISSTSATVSSRSSVPTSSTTVHSHQPSLPSGATTDVPNGKNKHSVTVEQLVPLIMQLVSAPAFGKLPETISRRQKHADNMMMMDSRATTLALHRTTSVQLSDDENEEEDEEEEEEDCDHHTATVLTEINENNTNSTNQKNSNGNQLFENRIESQHSGIISSLYQKDDSEDDDSDDQAATHSDTENDEGTKQTNPNTLSLMDFVVDKRPPPPSTTKTVSPPPPLPSSIVTENSIGPKKRSVSPAPIESSHDDNVYNQSKRKKFAGNRALLKAFSSSVHTKIDGKRPSLSISIPTELFFDLQDEPAVAVRRHVRTSKRYINGSVKHDTTSDNANDGMAPPPPPLLLNNQTSTTTNTNGIHQKKNKTSHVHDKIVYKQEQQQSSANNVPLVTIKNEQNIVSSDFDTSSNDDNKVRLPMTTTTTTTQPKKEKPTANVKPLQQSTPIDSSSSTNSIPNGGIRAKVPSGTSNPAHARTVLPSSTKMNYAKLKNMSIRDLDSLARQKKKQADGGGKRANFDEARQSMALYLESVCYFILCAHDEPVQDRRANLLTTTLTMLQELMRNHQKMFNPTQSNQVDILCNVRPKFLLIIYWLQSLIYHLQFNGNMPQIERCANQVSDYFNQLKNPSSAAALTTATRITSTTTTTTTTTVTQQAQLTPVTDSNPISPLSTASQASSSDQSTASVNGTEHHRVLLDFSKMMLNSYHSNYFWNKAERLMRDKPLKDFTEQLQKQNQNRRLTRDETTLDFVLYIFDAIELLRLSPA